MIALIANHQLLDRVSPCLPSSLEYAVTMNRKSLSFGFIAVALSCVMTQAYAGFATPKYVFFFLGDGMANAQIQTTEAYLTTINGSSATNAEDLLNPVNRLYMTQMPVQGMQTTYDAFALMTDSASAGTAFACGIKTKSGVIGMDETMSSGVKSVAQLAHEGGWKVGVMSSVSLNHATPAAYYASVSNRGYYNNIASQLAATGYEFFGGGGLLSPTESARSGDTENNVWELLESNGYTVLQDKRAILQLKRRPIDRVVAINPQLAASAAMPYAIDKPDGNLTLAEMTQVAIENLQGLDERGFFLMVEGGKIDWACHANDAVATFGDMLDFDDAVGVALEFAERYPLQTLIVVTGDHETGGMSVGHATTAYSAHYDVLLGQINSYEYFGENQWADHKAEYEQGYDWTDEANLAGNADMLGLMQSVFGLDWETLNAYQQEKLEDAYDKSMSGMNNNSDAENNLLYGYYEPIIVTLTHIVNEQASVGWTSYSHTGVPVPVYAAGPQAVRFAGFYDNTDVAKRLAQAMGLPELPVER